MASSVPDADLLLRISKQIFTEFDCRQLAVHLQLESSDSIVDAALVKTKDPNAIAFEVLKKWSHKLGVTGRTLYNALNTDPFGHLARMFEKELLPKGRTRHHYFMMTSIPLVYVETMRYPHKHWIGSQL